MATVIGVDGPDGGGSAIAQPWGAVTRLVARGVEVPVRSSRAGGAGEGEPDEGRQHPRRELHLRLDVHGPLLVQPPTDGEARARMLAWP